jgi:hypothetical protein
MLGVRAARVFSPWAACPRGHVPPSLYGGAARASVVQFEGLSCYDAGGSPGRLRDQEPPPATPRQKAAAVARARRSGVVGVTPRWAGDDRNVMIRRRSVIFL